MILKTILNNSIDKKTFNDMYYDRKKQGSRIENDNMKFLGFLIF